MTNETIFEEIIHEIEKQHPLYHPDEDKYRHDKIDLPDFANESPLIRNQEGDWPDPEESKSE